MKSINDEVMKLYAIGVSEQSKVENELVHQLLSDEELSKNQFELEKRLTISKEQATLIAVASMFQANNQALQEKLKLAGIVLDKE
ncbi:hypothetical protein [Paenibacillus sp. GXUN7292]|uniref:hypothetical protein n=1 Tax=Paenibacillus sp. GXUN7292 TaxID=3422499 RepID=UPI003D7E5A67